MSEYIKTYQEKWEKFIETLTKEEKTYHLDMMQQIGKESQQEILNKVLNNFNKYNDSISEFHKIKRLMRDL